MTPRSKPPLFAIAALLLCVTTAAAQQNQGTAEQRAACAPDAFRLCFGEIPDPVKVEGCLRQRQSELSGACRTIFEQSTASAGHRIKVRQSSDSQPATSDF